MARFFICGELLLDYTDLGTQPRLLKRGATIRLRLLKAKDEFTLQAKSFGHEKASEEALVQMPFTRIETKTFTLSSGLKSVIIPNTANNGVQIPMTAYTLSYKNDLYTRNYLGVCSDLAQHSINVTNTKNTKTTPISFFDLTQDFSASNPFMNVARSGDYIDEFKLWRRSSGNDHVISLYGNEIAYRNRQQQKRIH
ncbi:uncharacterized protein CEXT_266901 [Caerostris extrusa]|uniref:Uncharacterized protein n=1 Tax=Caerostris extrusa TaxID=172846 RepID=A0AAV4UTS7_CAEEX|nr:uncharacterized protein CEXT_266901 [Caerostris extrusa]